jgi:hypothetical protein
MTTLIGTYDLLNRHTGEFEDAQVFTPIGDNNIVDFETLWRPAFQKRLARVRSREELAAANLQDHHWQWGEKARERAGRLDCQSFAIECDGQTQGLMFVKTTAFARESSQKSQHLVYIDLLATAPWNRHGFTDRPAYKGVGRLLLVAAISLSVAEEFKGRIALHSLPQSESWYRDICGMTDLGIDKAYNYPPGLRYFEMTEAQAKAFIGP